MGRNALAYDKIPGHEEGKVDETRERSRRRSKKKRRWPLQFLSIAAEISAAPAIVSARSSAMMDDGRPCYRTTPSHWPGPSRSSLTSRRLPVNPPPPPPTAPHPTPSSSSDHISHRQSCETRYTLVEKKPIYMNH